jgi:dienelactone hydrolase
VPRLHWCAGIVLAGSLVLAAGCSAGSASPPHVRLDAGPVDAPFIAPVHIEMRGLPAGLVTVQAQAHDYEGRLWQSAAQFRVGANGTLNLATATPVSGSYHVADAAGLLWSLQPAFAHNPQTQFDMANAGFTVRLRVLVGGRVQASAMLIRSGVTRVAPSVQTVRRDGFASTLFTPNQIRPGAPAVVVIGGSEGGENTFKALALALAGYPALALGYFGEPGLPRCLCDIPLEYFAKAVRWLRAQPVARGRPLVLFGASRGAEGALLIASYEPGLFDAVVASSPSSFVISAFGPGAITVAGVHRLAWTFHAKALPLGMEIPVGRIRVPLLLGDGGQDAVANSAVSVSIIMSELQAAHDPAPYTNIYYPQAGHSFLGTPPYVPLSGYGTVGNSYFGGTQQANALAMEQSWTKMLSFLNDPWRRLR